MALTIVQPMPVADVKARAAHIQELVKSLMVEDVHFMVIPGTKNRTLTKQGSEMLLTAFHISIEPEIIENHDEDAVRYTVKVTGRHMGTGIVVGVGLGRCSSNEEKYKWRSASCRQEWEATPESRRRSNWKWGDSGAYEVKQIRTNPEDVGNTILKMAKKRAQVDLCLTCLAASDAFKRQPRPSDSYRVEPPAKTSSSAAPAASNAAPAKPSTAPQQAKPEQPAKEADKPRPATQAQITLLKRRLDDAGLAENHFLAQFEIGSFEELPFDQVNLAFAWIAELVKGPPDD